MTRFPTTEARVAYDHLTFRTTVEVLKEAAQLEGEEFWTLVRDEGLMTNVAQAMLHAAASQLRRATLANDAQEDSRAGSTAISACEKVVVMPEATKKE